MRDLKTGKRVQEVKVKKENRFYRDLTMITIGLVLVALIQVGLYIRPRYNAYINAVRVAHEHPEAVEALKIDKITKSGTFKLNLSLSK